MKTELEFKFHHQRSQLRNGWVARLAETGGKRVELLGRKGNKTRKEKVCEGEDTRGKGSRGEGARRRIRERKDAQERRRTKKRRTKKKTHGERACRTNLYPIPFFSSYTGYRHHSLKKQIPNSIQYFFSVLG